MDEKETIQKTINFIASEIRENKIQLKKLNQTAGSKSKTTGTKGVIYNGFRKNNLRFHQITAINLRLRKDRVLWISDDKKDVDEERFKRHARRILNTCISLGPVYIKFGQWLSSRADILPEPYMKELSNCKMMFLPSHLKR